MNTSPNNGSANPFDTFLHDNNNNRNINVGAMNNSNMTMGSMVPANQAPNHYNQYQLSYSQQQQPSMTIIPQQPQMTQQQMPQQQQQASTSRMSFDPMASNTTALATAPQPSFAPQPYSNYQTPQTLVPAPAPAINNTNTISNDDDDVFGIFGGDAVVGKEINVSSRNLNSNTTGNTAVPEEDETSVLSFSSAPQQNLPYRQQQQLRKSDNDGAGSVSSRSTSNRICCLDNPAFAPPPAKNQAIINAHILAKKTTCSSPLPNFGKISHSGYILSRISFRTILLKRWKQVFWIMYGPHTLYFFRNYQDFMDWVSNPYLTLQQRQFLVKLKLDFMGDLLAKNVKGYQVTRIRQKSYQKKRMSQFKLERWMEYGPTIAAAFASIDGQEANDLRMIMMEIMKRSPQGFGMQQQPQQQRVDYDSRSVSSESARSESGGGYYTHGPRNQQLPVLQDDSNTVQTDPAHPYQYNNNTGEFDVYGPQNIMSSSGSVNSLNTGFRAPRTVGRAR